MTKVFLITHPDVVINKNQPIDEWVLSDKGLMRVENLMNKSLWEGVDVIYSSTEPKAKFVAEMAANKFNIPLFEKNCLIEIDRSSTGFLPYDEFMSVVEDFFKKPNESCRGWEKASVATLRISECVQNVVKENKGQSIVLVGHGAIFALLLCYIKKIQPTIDMCQYGVGFIAEVDWDQKEIISSWKKY